MAVYVCSRCDSYVDGDWHPCTPDPDIENGLMCESCAEEVGDVLDVSRPFSASQLETIKKLEAESDEN